MATLAPPPAENAQAAQALRARAARRQIRGSSLLMLGRCIAMATKFAAQVLVVRYLTVADYGTWTYGLAAVAFLGGFAHLSLDRATTRFAAIYHQRRQYDRLFGVLLLVLGVIAVTGTLFVASLYLFPALFSRALGGAPAPLALLFILIFMVPLEALGTLLLAMITAFARPSTIFVRRYLVTPATQLAAVLLLIARGADLAFLAYGYVAGTLIGTLISGWMLVHVLREQGLLSHFDLRHVTLPTRELFEFSLPLMTSDWLAALIAASGTLVLGYFHDTTEVAHFRIVFQMAVLNSLVMQSFGILFEPTAARMYADDDLPGIHHLYWSTTLWIAVLTFPVFAATFVTATPLTVLAYGERYASSGTILAILAFGHYVQAATGTNGNTLKVVGAIRYLVGSNLVAAVFNIALTVLLVPYYGAVGAAVAMTATLIVHNVLKQFGLKLSTGFPLFERSYAPFFAGLGVAMAGLWLVRWLAPDRPAVLVAAAVLSSIGVLLGARSCLQVGSTFPELLRVPLLRRVFA